MDEELIECSFNPFPDGMTIQVMDATCPMLGKKGKIAGRAITVGGQNYYYIQFNDKRYPLMSSQFRRLTNG